MKKEMSTHAKAAKEIRTYLKTKKVLSKVTSDCYSMGTSVHIKLIDVRPEVATEIENEVNKYQYGDFDGMTDCYNYTNRRADLPQVKYVQVQRDLSDEMRASVRVFLEKKFDITDDKTARAKWDCWYDQAVWQTFSDRSDRIGFWR
jgi:hypothetical protein